MAQSKYYNTGGGSLTFTPIVDGVLGVEEDFGQTENISFSTEVETLTHDNTETCTTYEDMNILKKVTGKLSIETLEISPTMLTRAFLGSNSTTSVIENATGTTPALGFVTATALDTAYAIGVKHLDDSTIVVQDDADTVTYVLDTDYTLERKGDVTYITFPTSGGTITADDVLHIVADNSAYDDITIEGYIDTKLEGVLTFTSCASNGVSYVYTFHRVSLLASGDYALKSSEEFAKLAFEGTMLASELVSGAGISKLFKIEGTELTA